MKKAVKVAGTGLEPILFFIYTLITYRGVRFVSCIIIV